MARAKGWHKSDIKAALEKRGLTLSGLDRANGLPEGTCSAALRKPHPKGEAVISSAMEVSPPELWPSRYETDGTRKRPQPAANYKSPRRRGHRQNGIPICQSGARA